MIFLIMISFNYGRWRFFGLGSGPKMDRHPKIISPWLPHTIRAASEDNKQILGPGNNG